MDRSTTPCNPADANLWRVDRLRTEAAYFSRLFEVDIDDYRDRADCDDEGVYGYCPECECNVRSVRRDFGIGSYEYWGSHGVHHDWREVCPTCEGDLSNPIDEDEELESEA